MEYISFTKETESLKRFIHPFEPADSHLTCLSLKTMTQKIRVDTECMTLKLQAVKKKQLRVLEKSIYKHRTYKSSHIY